MKKSPTIQKQATAKRATAARSASREAPRSSPPAPTASRVPLGPTPATALAVLEPAARPGVAAPRRVRFGYFKPEAQKVHVVGSFNGWDPLATPLRRDGFGDWSTEIELPPGAHRYRFFVDGEWRDDPSAQQTTQNPFGGFDAIMVVV